MNSTTAADDKTDDKTLKVSLGSLENFSLYPNEQGSFIFSVNESDYYFVDTPLPCKIQNNKILKLSISRLDYKYFRYFEINLGDLDKLSDLTLNYNEETDSFETETKGVFIKETTKYLQFKCDIEDVNAFMVNGMVCPIDKKIPCNFNSEQDIKFGHIDNYGNFLDCEKQPFIKKMCVKSFGENTYLDYDNTAIINVNDENGKLNISRDNATITFDEEHSKIINNKAPTIASFSLGGIFASSAVGFAIAAFAFSLAISPIIAGIIIAVSALASASCFIYGIIKKSHTYTPKKDEIQEPETKSDVIPSIDNNKTSIEVSLFGSNIYENADPKPLTGDDHDVKEKENEHD